LGKLKAHSVKVENWISGNPYLIVFVYRYLYGFRIITLLTMGIGRFPVKKFLLFSFFSIMIWTVIFTLLGYYMGELISILIGEYKFNGFHVTGFLTGIAIVLLFTKYAGKRLIFKGTGKQ
jgi:membrane protein DedA with SNARE-associated domain